MDPLHDQIAKRAYSLFEARGCVPGQDLADWFEAERSVIRDETWRLEGPSASLTVNVDDATTVLRMGIAANAVRAAQRFFYFVKDARGPRGERDRLWAFLIALGFLDEAIQTVLRPAFPRIRVLAISGGVESAVVTTTADLLSGRLPLNSTLDRMRNKLIFHWDSDLIREYASGYSRDSVTWADGIGDTQGEALYRVAADALTNSILPDEPRATSERNEQRLRQLLDEALPATTAVLRMFDMAIAGHVKTWGAQLKRH